MLPLIAAGSPKNLTQRPCAAGFAEVSTSSVFSIVLAGRVAAVRTGDNCAGWSCRVSDAGCRTVPTSDARLSTRRRLYVHVNAVHRRVLDRVSNTDNRLTGRRNTSVFARTAYHVTVTYRSRNVLGTVDVIDKSQIIYQRQITDVECQTTKILQSIFYITS